MIEMHQGEDPDDVDAIGDSADGAPRRSVLPRIVGLVATGGSLGIAALLISFASLLLIQDGSELGDAAYVSHGSGSDLTVYRVSSGFRLAIAVIGFSLALFAVGKVFLPADGELDDDADAIADPLWVRAVVGAALVVGLVAIAAAAVAFIYAMQAHVAPNSEFGRAG